jgi:uncharacterized membrane protein
MSKIKSSLLLAVLVFFVSSKDICFSILFAWLIYNLEVETRKNVCLLDLSSSKLSLCYKVLKCLIICIDLDLRT